MQLNKFLRIIIACLMVLFNCLPEGIAKEDTAPAAKNDPAKDETSARPGSSDKISLDLKNVDILELLRIVSLKTGKTIVPSKDVSGRITVYLSNVAFNDVLDIILLTQGLALNQDDNVYYVMTDAEYRKIFGRDYIDHRKIETVRLSYAKPAVVFSALSQLKSDAGKIVVDESTGTVIMIDMPEKLDILKSAIRQMDQPLTTTVFDLNYVKTADAKAQLNAAITPGTGEVIIDERSGKAIVTDLPRKMDKLGSLVRELDEESRQVYVETDIVELTLNDDFERGIDWEKVWTSAAMDGLAISGSFPAALTTLYQEIKVGTFATNHYEAILKFLNTYGTTRVISQPRIAVVNNEEANIMVGTREAYITQTQSQATSTTVTSETVEFIDVGVKLKIVPRIGADGFITIKLKPEVSSVKETITTELGSRVPIVQTSQSETVVKVKDGMMIMIAGMTKTELTDTIVGWPVLSKIPILGIFFSKRTKNADKTEVIIFLTPHLTRGDVSLRGHDITKIIPAEHLPKNLQEKVIRDNKIDETIFDSEATPAVKAQLAQQKNQARINARQKMKDDAYEKAERIKEDASAKAADRAAEMEAQQVLNVASIKAGKTLKEKPVFTKVTPLEQNAPEKLLPNDAKEKAKDFYRQGLDAQAEGKFIDAEDYFKKSVELDAKFAAAFNSLGVIYEQEERLAKAEEMYLKAISVDANCVAAYSNLALFNESKNNLGKALEYWRKRVVYGEPNDPWTKKAAERVVELGDAL